MPIISTATVRLTRVAVMVVLSLLWCGAVACLLSIGPLTTAYLRGRRWIDRTADAIFIAFGARLAADR